MAHTVPAYEAEAPIALCEVQGYVYAAYLGRAELAEAFGDYPTATQLRDRAAQLRIKFAEQFWLPERGWYAVALDGGKRKVESIRAALRGKWVTTLITDLDVAQALLDA